MKRKSYFWYLLTTVAVIVLAGSCNEKEPEIPPTDEKITFEMKVSNILPHGADMEIIPSDKECTYLYDVAPAKVLDGMKPEEIVASLIEGVKTEDLVSGDIRLSGSQMDENRILEAETEYILVALGYEDGKVRSELAQERFTTVKEPESGVKKPEIELTASYNPEIQKLIFVMKCTTHDAVKATNLATSTVGLDGLLGEGYALRDIMDPTMDIARVLNEEQLALLNGDGLALKLGVDEGIEPDMEVACVLCVWNEEGGRNLKRVDIEFEGAAKSDVRLTGNYDEKTQTVSFDMRCVSGDAVYAASLLVESDELNQNLDKGFTMGQIMNPEANNLVRIFTDKEVEQLNTSEVSFTIEQIVPGLSYAFVLEVKNEGGARSIKRVDIIAGGIDPNPGEGPEIEVSGVYDPETEMVLFDTRCLSGDVSVGSTLIFKKETLDEIIASIPLTELMLPTIGFAVKMTPDELVEFNDQGLRFTAGVKDGFEPHDNISFVVYGKDSSNEFVIKRVDVHLDVEWKTHTGKIELQFDAGAGDGYGNDRDKMIYLDAYCTTKNADHAAILLTNADDLQELLDSGKTLDEILDENRNSSKMESWNYNWIQNMNSDGGTQLWMSVASDRKYTLIFEVTNLDNKVVETVDIVTAAREPEIGEGESKVQEIGDKKFREYIWDFVADKEWKFKGKRPAVVDFFAVWCGPCKAMSPIMDRLSIAYENEVDFYKVNVEDAVDATYKIMTEMQLNPKNGIPFFLFIDAEGNIKSVLGRMEEVEVRKYIEQILKGLDGTEVKAQAAGIDPAVSFEYLVPDPLSGKMIGIPESNLRRDASSEGMRISAVPVKNEIRMDLQKTLQPAAMRMFRGIFL